MPSINMIMLQTVAAGLRELRKEVVFIGGAVAELYADDPEASDIRPTLDIDCVVQISSKIEYNKLEDKLRNKKFSNDTSPGAPICRWVFNDIKVDVMPADTDILGFTNSWYTEGIENKMVKTLEDGTEIFVFTPEYYLAAKFEAHDSRGGNDLRQSHDFEDIVYIFENRSSILDDISCSNLSVKEFIKEACRNLKNNDNLKEGIECALPYGSDSDSTEIIEDIILNIAKMKV